MTDANARTRGDTPASPEPAFDAHSVRKGQSGCSQDLTAHSNQAEQPDPFVFARPCQPRRHGDVDRYAQWRDCRLLPLPLEAR
jgi:hypothetical protein